MTTYSIDHLNLIAHPHRLRILAAFGRQERMPRDIAEATGIPLGTVSYHVRSMAEGGALTLTDTFRVRGAVAHRYRVTPAAHPLLRELRALTQKAAKAVPTA